MLNLIGIMGPLRRRLFWLPLLYIGAVYAVTWAAPPPTAVALAGPLRSASDVVFLADNSWVDKNGQRHLQQQIFDAVVSMINGARQVILLDMFLFNHWQGPVRESHRALADEITQALIRRKRALPEIAITVVSDPINTVYGSLQSPHFDALRAAGIAVVITDLTRLQDSNPLYSAFWRWLVRPFGSGSGDYLPNPFGAGTVSLRSYLALANFKANHRKLLIADRVDGELQALILSGNPHDGSSAHRNVALQFTGEAVFDLVRSEHALLSMSGAEHGLDKWPSEWLEKLAAINPGLSSPDHVEQIQGPALRIVNDSRIKDAVINGLNATVAGDRIDLLMFYLADRQIIQTLIAAHRRGAEIRVLLDVNRDAFGRSKNGVPNRPVAAELVAAGNQGSL